MPAKHVNIVENLTNLELGALWTEMPATLAAGFLATIQSYFT